jgi:hypothetical protein
MNNYSKEKSKDVLGLIELLMVLFSPIAAVFSIVVATFSPTSILSIAGGMLAIYSLLVWALLSLRRKIGQLTDLLRIVQSDSVDSRELLRVLSVHNNANDLKLRKIVMGKYPHLFERLGSFCMDIKECIERNQLDINKKPFSMLDFVQYAQSDIRSTSYGNISSWWDRYESRRYLSETYRKITNEKVSVKRLFIADSTHGFDDEMNDIILSQKKNGINVKVIGKQVYRDLLLKFDSRTTSKITDIVIIDSDFISVSEIDPDSGDDVIRYISLALDESSKERIQKHLLVFDSIFALAEELPIGGSSRC